ncbi:hypothetical protein KFK09_008715 [Dendrobium nobile]|uniref:Uncharacterized protein n=1 Tax=Dendrobium nobile TaxID=94219 RepID=A0A8T3BRM5_DENNO|nr:hypothetical protein KFK09_008715 [Dendrobium nobile]
MNISNLVPTVIIPMLSDSNQELLTSTVREVEKKCEKGMQSNSESVCPSDKSDDQWEECEIISDEERYTLKELNNMGKALSSLGSKDDSDWTFIKIKNRYKRNKRSSKPSTCDIRIIRSVTSYKNISNVY